jgi:hypothetical protein
MSKKETVIIEAISKRMSVSFEYSSETDSVRGLRYFNPHVLYRYKSIKTMETKIYLEGWQYKGVSKSGKSAEWKRYTLHSIIDPVSFLDGSSFEISPLYKSTCPRYVDSISKI